MARAFCAALSVSTRCRSISRAGHPGGRLPEDTAAFYAGGTGEEPGAGRSAEAHRRREKGDARSCGEKVRRIPFPLDRDCSRSALDLCEVIGSHGWRVLAILSALMGFASISTDLYLPAIPAMGRALRANGGSVEWTISGYLIGFSLGQLFWGPVGDRYGRRLPVAIGLVLFVVGSAGCAMAGSIWA
jgi:hypothetical protein